MISHSNENAFLDDANSPEINKSLMGKISEDFIKVCDHLKEASFQIRKRDFSKFPIFMLHHEVLSVGSPLFFKADFKTQFNYSVSMMEDFVTANLIGAESVELFKEYYKDPEEFCCLFVVDGEFAGFVYLPFPTD
jgi:hypothetical protein